MTENKIQTDEIELTKKLFEVKGENGTQLMGRIPNSTASTAEW